jgi:hypothetical protein
MERPARTKRRTQICCLGGRSFSSDITMPLRLTTACACLAARWRADLPAQSPPYGVAVRGSIPCRARLVRPGRIRGARFNLSRTEPRGPRRKRIGLRPTTACACLAALWRADLPAQSPPCGVSPKREIGAQPPNSNRSRYRLEFNISPTKQRTEVLSNRSYKWRFGEPNQPARQLCGGPHLGSASSLEANLRYRD